jgi:hypothetical protein
VEDDMKKLAALVAFGVVLSTGAASAQMMQSAYNNTIVVTYANGAQSRYQFNSDNTFSVRTPDGQTVTGTYAVEGEQICLTPAGGERGCTQYVGEKNVGDTWTQTATDGSQITVTLESGR